MICIYKKFKKENYVAEHEFIGGDHFKNHAGEEKNAGETNADKPLFDGKTSSIRITISL